MSLFSTFRAMAFQTPSFWTLLVAGMALASSACHQLPTTHDRPAPAAETVDAERFSPDALQADLDALYTGLQEAHYDLFALSSRATWEAGLEALRAELDRPLDRTAAQLLFQRFAALARSGHTRIEFPQEAFAEYRAAGGRTVPFFIRVIGERVVVTEAYGPAGKLRVGDEIVAIDDQPIADWLDRLRRHISAETPYLAHSLLEFWFPRLMWIELGPVDRLTVEVRRADRAATELVAVETLTGEGLQQALAATPERLELDWNGRSFRVLDDDVAYLRPGAFYAPEQANPYDSTAFAAFLDDAFDAFQEAGCSALIIDLRDNPGGDNSFSDRMVAWLADRPFRFNSSFRIRISEQTIESNRQRLEATSKGGGTSEDTVSQRYADLFADHAPGDVVDYELPFVSPRDGRRFDGSVYVLVNRHSFSNAVNVAALIQDYGFGLVLGEETADMATAYGAMEHFELPHTGLRVGYPKAFIVRPSGDETLRGVVPDIAIATPLVEAPDDPVLQRAVAIVHQRRSSGAGE